MFTSHVLPHYDIVCLQELFHVPLTGRRSRFIEQAKARGFLWQHHSVRKSTLSPSIDGGLLMLSKLPIVAKDALVFSNAAFADWYAGKGALYCLIQCGPSRDHFIHVFCTHLQATYDSETKQVSENVRIEQLGELAAFIEKCTKAHSQGNKWPVTICGDLNVQCRQSTGGCDSEEYSTMMKALKNGLGFKGEFLRDLTKEIDGVTHPVTYGEAAVDKDSGSLVPAEKTLTDVEDFVKHPHHANQALDKIFWIPATERIDPLFSPSETLVNPMTIEKDKWHVHNELSLTHLSDHYAVETTLTVKLH